MQLFSGVASASGTDPHVIIYHTQEWKGVTNRDGTGLYHEILRAIYEPHGMTFHVEYFPHSRAVGNVAKGIADISGGTPALSKDYIRGKYPLWVSQISALFRKEYLESWQGIKTIQQHSDSTVSAQHVGRVPELHTYEVASRVLGLKMLLAGRMRYFIDDYAILNDLIHGSGEGLAFEGGDDSSVLGDVDWSHYVVQPFYEKGWYMVFPNNERGKKLRDIFDAGYRKLHKSGRLAKMYKKWGVLDCMLKKVE